MKPTATLYRFFNPRIHRGRIRLSAAWRAWKPRAAVPPKWECTGQGLTCFGDTPAAAYERWALTLDRALAARAQELMVQYCNATMNSRNPWSYGGQYIGFGWQQ